jgi:hypothetical protein
MIKNSPKSPENPETTKALELIASKLTKGENVDAELDELLGTRMPERDLETERAWECNRMRQEIDEGEN